MFGLFDKASYLPHRYIQGTVALALLLITPFQVLAGADMSPMRTVSKDECSKVVTSTNVDASGLLPTTDIDLFKVTYKTKNFDGKSEKVSGLYAKPSGADGNGTVLYFHGTVAGRGDVPSQEYNLLETCLFAGQGFAFLAADYIGLGDSTVEAPYFHREATVNAGLDLVRAVDKLVDLDKRLFIVGYSQGGHGALSATREVDLNGLEGFRFVASAPGAGPYYLYELLFIDPLVKNPEPQFASMHILKLVRSYENAYPDLHGGEEVNIQPAWDKAMALLDGTHTTQEVLAAMPPIPHDVLIKKDYLEKVASDKTMPLAKAFIENSVEPWPAKVPITLIYPGADKNVTPESSIRMHADLQAANAKEVELINIGDKWGHIDGYPSFLVVALKKMLAHRDK